MPRDVALSPKLAGRRILLTGSDTGLGSAVCEKLKEAGAVVVATRAVADDAWDSQFLDITSFDAVLKSVAFHDPVAIVHCSNIAPPDASIYAAVSLIVQGTKNVVDMGKPLVVVADYIDVEQGRDVDLCMAVADRMASEAGAPVVSPATGWAPADRARVVVNSLEGVLRGKHA